MTADPTFVARLQAAAAAAIADAAPTLEPEPGRLQFVTIELALGRHGEVLESTCWTGRVPAPGGQGFRCRRMQ